MVDRRIALGALLVAISALLFSGKGVVVKLAYTHGVDAVTVLTLRYAWAMPLAIAIAWWEEQRLVLPMPLGLRLQVMGLGLIGYYISSLLDFLGLCYIDVNLERMVLFIYPTLVVAITTAMTRTRPTQITLVALIMTYIGVIMCAWDHVALGAHAGIGIALVAGSALCYAVFIVASARTIRIYGGTRVMATVLIGAGAAMFVHFAVTHPLHDLCVSTPVLMHGAILGIGGTILPALCMGAGMARVGAQRFAIISAIGPAGTVVLAWLILGERPTPISAVGMALTIFASVAMGVAKTAPAKSTASKPAPG